MVSTKAVNDTVHIRSLIYTEHSNSKIKKKTTSIGPYKYSQNEDERLLARFKK